MDLGFRSSVLGRLIVAGCDFRLFKSVGLLFGVAFFIKFLPRAAKEGQVHPGRDPLYPGKADFPELTV